jgi:multicomponent Na+:H+ antiporter subunit D
VGLAAAVLYTVVNALNKALLFLATELRGALVAGAFAVGAFSVAGVPPAAGYLGKLEMFRTGITAASPALIALFVAGSALSLVYVFEVYQRRFWRPEPAEPAAVGSWPARAPIAVLALVVLGLGLWPEPLLVLSAEAAQALLTPSPGGSP